MRVSPEEFEAYLAPGETVVERVPGTVVDGSYRSEGAIGLTDRRVLFVADGDRFLDVSHGSISSIRSGPRSTVTAAGVGYPLLVAAGVVLAVGGLLGAVALRPGLFAFVLAAVTVAGATAAEYARRSGLDVDVDAAEVAGRLRRGAVPEALRALGDVEVHRGRAAGDNDALVLALGLVSLFALVGLVVLAGSLLVLPLVAASIVGVACADYGYRRHERLDASGETLRHEQDVRIHLVDGRVIDLRVDAADRIDRSLSGVVRAPEGRDAAGSDHSPTTVSGTGR